MGQRHIKIRCLTAWGALFCAFALSLPGGVAAQDEQPPAETLRVFLPEDFAAYSPVTARDALNRLPGLEIVGGGTQRGLGGGGNVLINGERAGGKSNSALDQLARLSANTIVRIEVYAAGTSVFDAAGASQVINVVLNQEDGGISGTYRGRILYRPRLNVFNGDISASANWTKGALTFDLAFETDGSKTPTFANETLTDFDVEAPNTIRSEDRRFRFRDYEFTGGLAWKINPDQVFRLTAIGQFSDERDREFTQDFVATDGVFDIADYRFNAEGVEAEVTAEYEQRLSPKVQLKLTALSSIDIFKDQSASTVTTQSGGGSIFQLGNEFDQSETVLRARTVWSLSPRHSLTAQLEGAYNKLDAKLFQIESPLDAPADVVRVADNLGSSSLVQEYRGDVFLEHQWTLTDAFTLTSRLAGEISSLTVSGTSENSRTLKFPKPQVELNYQVSPVHRLRFFAQRAIGQLDFFDFTASVSLVDDEERGSTGQLRPQREWLNSVTWEMQLPRSSGRTSARVFYDIVQDVVASAPVSDDAFETLETISNIGTAKRYGIEAEYSVRLGPFGLPDILLEGSVTAQKTSIEDPVTGLDRRLGEARPIRYRFDYRHDVTKWRFSYGINAILAGEQRTFELNQVVQSRQQIDLNVFVETQAIKGITLRLSGWNLLDREEQRLRFISDPNRIIDLIPLIEGRDRKRGRGILLSLDGVY